MKKRVLIIFILGILILTLGWLNALTEKVKTKDGQIKKLKEERKIILEQRDKELKENKDLRNENQKLKENEDRLRGEIEHFQISRGGSFRDKGNTSMGKAKWYCKGQMTASGEPFNPQGMTAASNILPFGTMVKVTNLSNRKSVIVKITDRGGFEYPVIIDLSCGAFKQIADLYRGVIPVRLEW